MSTLEAVIIAIVEGITEFLPVSSTGHMIITQELLGMEINDFVKAFTVNIQFGAILSVIVLYWKRFFQTLDFYFKLFVAFIPAAIIGFLLSDFIDSMLESVTIVAIMLVLGGVVLIFVDKWFKNPAKDQTIAYPTAFKIGLYQCIAMIPGVSRSAATIIGGMSQGLDRKTAAEFSFLLAVPTMFAASGYKLLQNYKTITPDNIDTLLIGNAVAFIVAMIAIKSFITFLTKYGFKLFGYYRIVVGLIILAMLAMGYDLNIA
ncbi:MAG: undecaprenyl-diphosphate phosphatase, partial [Lentimicrobium sp.]|nr:undecaprenyl-diphosphate phosphatase [Lentimicrobium sp.]